MEDPINHPPPPEPPDTAVETKVVTDIVVVKCGLRNVINLDNATFALLSATVERYVNIISRMMRRSSLVLLYHLTKLAQQGLPIPDLYHKKDTYWKNWLKLDIANNFVPSHDVIQSINDTAETVGQVMGTGPEFVEEYPQGFDQVLSYAGTTFATVVKNNVYVPLLPRLTRLTKHIVKARKPEAMGLHASDVMKQLRASGPD